MQADKILKKIIDSIPYVQDIKKERDEYRDMIMQGAEEDFEATAEMVVSRAMGRGINWFDYNGLPFTEKRQYYADIQSVLRNKSLANEINHIIADTVEFIAKSAKDFGEVEKMRMQINAMELLRERLQSLENPEKEKADFDENSAI